MPAPADDRSGAQDLDRLALGNAALRNAAGTDSSHKPRRFRHPKTHSFPILTGPVGLEAPPHIRMNTVFFLMAQYGVLVVPVDKVVADYFLPPEHRQVRAKGVTWRHQASPDPDRRRKPEDCQGGPHQRPRRVHRHAARGGRQGSQAAGIGIRLIWPGQQKCNMHFAASSQRLDFKGFFLPCRSSPSSGPRTADGSREKFS